MILPDVNVLIYAFRSDSVDHPKYRRWLEGVLRGVAPYGMSPQVLASVVRIVTHRRVFAEPDSLRTALAFAGQLLEQPHCQVILPGPRHWNIFCDLCRRASVQGNLVQDA